MKIGQITTNVFVSAPQKQKRQQQDLISFGIQGKNNQKEVLSLKAAQAVISNSIASISFKGKEIIDRKVYIGTSGIIIEPYHITTNPDETIHKTSKVICKDAYYNACLDIYYADEGEFITEDMKRKYHYIVTKNEPFLSLEHLKSNYRNGYEKFANRAVKEIEYFEKLERNAKKGIEESKNLADEYRKNFEIAKEEKDRIDNAKKYHVWEEGKFDKQSQEADYYYDLNRKRLEENEFKKVVHESQIQRAHDRLPKAAAKYKLLKELDDKASAKDAYNEMGKEIEEINNRLKFINASLDGYYRDKELLNIFIKRLKKAELDGCQKDYNYDIKKTLKEDEKKLKRTEESIVIEEAEKLKHEQQIQNLKNNQAVLAQDFGRIDVQLDEIMSRIEVFYKENYPGCI